MVRRKSFFIFVVIIPVSLFIPHFILLANLGGNLLSAVIVAMINMVPQQISIGITQALLDDLQISLHSTQGNTIQILLYSIFHFMFWSGIGYGMYKYRNPKEDTFN